MSVTDYARTIVRIDRSKCTCGAFCQRTIYDTCQRCGGYLPKLQQPKKAKVIRTGETWEKTR